MMPNKALLFCSFLAFCIGNQLVGPAHAQASTKRQSCEGTVALDGDGMLQLTDTKKSASLWCDAYIGDDKNSLIANQVLAQCPLGSRCAIDGLFSGRGVFYWTKVISARRR